MASDWLAEIEQRLKQGGAILLNEKEYAYLIARIKRMRAELNSARRWVAAHHCECCGG